jgi:hypothetical protein
MFNLFAILVGWFDELGNLATPDGADWGRNGW